MCRIDATNEFASEPTISQGVITMLGSDVPTRSSGSQSLGDRCPIECLSQTDVTVNGVQTTLVRKQLSNCCITFAMLRKLWPIRADLFVIRQQATLNTHRDSNGSDSLGCREHQLQRVFDIRLRFFGVE